MPALEVQCECGWNPLNTDFRRAVEELSPRSSGKPPAVSPAFTPDEKGEMRFKELCIESPATMEILLEANGMVILKAEGHILARAYRVGDVTIHDRRETVMAAPRLEGPKTLEQLLELRDVLEKERSELCGSRFCSSDLTFQERGMLDSLNRDLKQIDNRLMSFPELTHRLRCWMVDVWGVSSQANVSADTMAKYLDGVRDRAGFTDHMGSELAERVHDVMVHFGGEVTDSGMGGGSWHLGCHCTEIEAARLLRALHESFAKQIAMGAIYLKKIPWGVTILEKTDDTSDQS